MNSKNTKKHKQNSEQQESPRQHTGLQFPPSSSIQYNQDTDLWNDGTLLDEVVDNESEELVTAPHPKESKEEDVPKFIGRYPVKKLIGKGATGTVYLGTHPGLERDVAIKLMRLNITKTREPLIRRFIQEAKITDRFNHPNIIRVYDAGEDESEGYFIVMEYAERGALSTLLAEKGRLDVHFAKHVIKGVANALSQAKNYNVIHRDIKPQNIMLTNEMEVKLADLGLAKYTHVETSETMTNVCIGTLYFMAPEQIQDAKRVDTRADIYALGATFYMLVTGTPPFKGDSHFEIMQKVVSGKFKRPETIEPSLDPRIGDIICKMMERKPEDRFQSAKELLYSLEQHENEEVKPKRQHRKYLLASALVGLVVFSLIFVQIWNAKNPINKVPNESSELVFKVSALVKKNRQESHAISHIPKVETYNEEIEQLLSEVNFSASNRNNHEAFEGYRRILKSLRKIDNIKKIWQLFGDEQQRLGDITGNAVATLPRLEQKPEWNAAKLLENEASSLLSMGDVDRAYKRLKEAMRSYKTILENTFQDEIKATRSKATISKQKADELKTDPVALRIWQEAEDLVSQTQTAFQNDNYLRAVKLWSMSISRYQNANRLEDSRKDAQHAAEKYQIALAQLDQSLLKNQTDSTWTSISLHARKAEQFQEDQKFDLAAKNWGLATKMITGAMAQFEKIKESDNVLTLAGVVERPKGNQVKHRSPTTKELTEQGTRHIDSKSALGSSLKKAQTTNEYFDILISELKNLEEKNSEKRSSSSRSIIVGDFICENNEQRGLSKLSGILQNSVEQAVDRSSELQLITRKYSPARSQNNIHYKATEAELNDEIESDGVIYGSYTYHDKQINLDVHLDLHSSGQKSLVNIVLPINKFATIVDKRTGEIDQSWIFPANMALTNRNENDIDLIGKEIPNRRIGLDLWLGGGRRTYTEGEYINLIVRPEKPCHIAVFCHYVDGSTVLLFPNEYNRETFVRAKRFISIPGEPGTDDKEGFDLEVGPPFGGDIIQVIACTEKQALHTLLKDKVPVQAISQLAAVDRTTIKSQLRGLKRGIKVVPTNSSARLGEKENSTNSTDWGETRLALYTYPK